MTRLSRMMNVLLAMVILSVLGTGAFAASAKPDTIDRTHPLGLDYRQTYGVLTTKYQTPHVEWGKPLVGGPIRVLVMAPTWTHRETIELAQRLDIDFTAWMCYGATRLMPEDDTGKEYPVNWEEALGLVAEQPFATRKMVLGLLKGYLEDKYDVIVIGKLEWSIIPPEYRARILEHVRQGTGLVYVNPPKIGDELSQVFSEKPVAGSDYILRGVPWRSLPRLRAVDGKNLVRSSAYGKGRVVVLDYQQPFREPTRNMGKGELDIDLHSLTPAWVQVSRIANDWPHEEPTNEMGGYEYYQSLVARSVRWAARGATKIKLGAKLPTGAVAGKATVVPVTLQGAASAKSISYAVRTADGRQVIAKAIQLSASKARPISVTLPGLTAGSYMLDLWARDSNKRVLEWWSGAFEVKSSIAVESVELASSILEPGDMVKANVRLSKALQSGQKLRAQLWDLNGRCIDSRPFIPSGQEVEVTLGPLAPLHIMHELRLFVSQNGKDLVDYRYQFPVRAGQAREDFSSVIWANECSRNSMPTTLMMKKLHDVDETDAVMMVTGLLGRRPIEIEKRESEMMARVLGTANIMTIPNGGFGFGWGGGDEAVKGSYATEASLCSKVRLEAVTAQAKRDAEFFAPYGPFFWVYASETPYSRDLDIDWNPDALARFRRLLKENLYDSLDSLNKEWRTGYASWDQVMPISFADARRTGNYAPWVTHKLGSDIIFAEYLKYTEGVVGNGDKGARAGLDADIGLYGANFGYDWWLQSKYTSMDVSYTSHTTYDLQAEVKRSFGKTDGSTIRGMWTGLYGLGNGGRPSTIEYCRAHSWLSLFHSQNSDWWYTMGAPGQVSGYAADLTSIAPFAARTEELKEIKAGEGKLVLDAVRADDGIAIHWSESSRIVDNLFREETGYQNCEWENSAGGFARALEDAGFQYRFVAYEEIEKNALQAGKYRALFMPRSVAISDAEAANITEFVKNGGVVIADAVPGAYTKTGAKRATSALTQLFPTDAPGTATKFGQGYAVLTGEEMLKGYYQAHNGFDGWKTFGKRWEKIADLLSKYAKLTPAVSVSAKAGEMPPTEVARFNADGIELVGLLRLPWLVDNAEYQATVRLPKAAHLYDVRTGEYLGYTDRCDRTVDYQAQLLAMSPYKVKSVDVKPTGKAIAGKPLQFTAAVLPESGEASGRHVLRVTVIGPDGKELKWYAQNVVAPAGKGSFTIPFALSDPAGRYRLTVRDCMSGVSHRAQIVLGKP